MKYIKKYENNRFVEQLAIGDYVYCIEKTLSLCDLEEEVRLFIKNNIGQYIGYKDDSSFAKYKVKYENVPKKFYDYFFDGGVRLFLRSEIEMFNKDKETLETIINSNKYNL